MAAGGDRVAAQPGLAAGGDVAAGEDRAHLGVNAIDKVFVIYEALNRLEEEWAETKRHPLFPNGKFSLLPGVIHGSPYGIDVPFFLSEQARIEYCVMFHPGDDCATAKAEIERQIDLAAQMDPWLREHPPVVEWKLEWQPYVLDPEHPVLPLIERAHERAVAGTRLLPPLPAWMVAAVAVALYAVVYLPTTRQLLPSDARRS